VDLIVQSPHHLKRLVDTKSDLLNQDVAYYTRGKLALSWNAKVSGARFVQLDVTDDVSVAAAFAQIEADGGLDVVVNNAGIGMLALNGPAGRRVWRCRSTFSGLAGRCGLAAHCSQALVV
jgi:NAD(P)-dependent dehydrogenase (short-subunit alcohol dehydrogenase family)